MGRSFLHKKMGVIAILLLFIGASVSIVEGGNTGDCSGDNAFYKKPDNLMHYLNDHIYNASKGETFKILSFDDPTICNVGYSVQQTEEGYTITGNTGEYNWDRDFDILLIETDKDGNKEWIKTFEFLDYSIGWSVRRTQDKGYNHRRVYGIIYGIFL